MTVMRISPTVFHKNITVEHGENRKTVFPVVIELALCDRNIFFGKAHFYVSGPFAASNLICG